MQPSNTAIMSSERWYQEKNAMGKTAADILMDWLTTKNNLTTYLLSDIRSSKSRADILTALANFLKSNNFTDISKDAVRRKLDTLMITYTQAREWMDFDSAEIWQKIYVKDNKEENVKRQQDEIRATVLKICPEFYTIDRILAKEELAVNFRSTTEDDIETSDLITADERSNLSKDDIDFEWEQDLLEGERDMAKTWRHEEHRAYLSRVEQLKEIFRERLIDEDEFKKRRQRLYYEMQEDFFSDKMGHHY